MVYTIIKVIKTSDDYNSFVAFKLTGPIKILNEWTKPKKLNKHVGSFGV